jgi:hypothetical protein
MDFFKIPLLKTMSTRVDRSRFKCGRDQETRFGCRGYGGMVWEACSNGCYCGNSGEMKKKPVLLCRELLVGVEFQISTAMASEGSKWYPSCRWNILENPPK